MALAIKRRGRQDLADLSGQCLVAALRLRSAPPQHSLGLRGDAELIVKARTRHLPFPRYAHHAVESSREGRSGAAHGFDLRQAKGRAASMRWIFSRSNSLLMLRSATKDFSRWVSSFSTSASRALRLASPPSRNWSRQPDRVAAVTPSSRERVSRSSPRSNRRIAAALRLADQRPRPSRRSSGAPPGLPAGLPKLVLSLCSQTPPCVISHPFSPQFGVQENPRAREGELVVRFLRAAAVLIISRMIYLLKTYRPQALWPRFAHPRSPRVPLRNQ